MPTTVADPRQSADSAQIRVATIALHTEQANTRNLQEAHVSKRQKYFIPCGLAISSCGLTSIPAITATALDKRAANGPNGAISLKQTFNRILYHFCNRQYFGVKKTKYWDREQSCVIVALNMSAGLQWTFECLVDDFVAGVYIFEVFS